MAFGWMSEYGEDKHIKIRTNGEGADFNMSVTLCRMSEPP